MNSALLISIQVGLPRQMGVEDAADPLDRPWSSAFFKEPVVGPVFVLSANVSGDGQADLVHHGGVDKAVLAYSAEHYPLWRHELSRPDLPYGAFGENFTIAGLDEHQVCIGDTFAIGNIRVQVSQPRQPCWKLGRRWRMQDLPARVIENGRSGWYLRVLEEGLVATGDPVTLLERPCAKWTVARANEIMYRSRQDQQSMAELAACPLLSAAWREHFATRLAKLA